MRALAIALMLVGVAATAWTVHGASSRPRPAAILFGLAAPVALALALLGGVLYYVPGFLR